MVRDDAGVVHPPLEALWRQDGVAMGCNAAVTVGVGVAGFAVATLTAASPQARTAFTLAITTAWIALAAAPLAASARTRLGAIGRAAVTADASLIILLILVLTGGDPLSFLGAFRIYILWAAMAVVPALLVGRGPHRLAVAAAISLLVGLALAHPLWAGGLKAALGGPSQPAAATVLEAIDPWNAVLDAAGPAVPAQRPLLDRLTQPARPGRPAWTAAALVWWSMAVIIAMGLGLGRTARRFVRGT